MHAFCVVTTRCSLAIVSPSRGGGGGGEEGPTNFFVTDTVSVHTHPMKTITENGTFQKALKSGTF